MTLKLSREQKSEETRRYRTDLFFLVSGILIGAAGEYLLGAVVEVMTLAQ
jgi:hypothetical protein